MQVKSAFIRAIRTAAQTAAAVLAAVTIFGTAIDLKVVGNLYYAAAVVGAHAGVISFLQNVAEDNTDVDVPKG